MKDSFPMLTLSIGCQETEWWLHARITLKWHRNIITKRIDKSTRCRSTLNFFLCEMTGNRANIKSESRNYQKIKKKMIILYCYNSNIKFNLILLYHIRYYYQWYSAESHMNHIGFYKNYYELFLFIFIFIF